MTTSRPAAAVLIAFIVTSCTASLWQRRIETEYVSGIYLIEQNRVLLVSGENHVYLFENIDPGLWGALNSTSEVPLRPYIDRFRLEQDNSISGELTLYASTAELSHAEKTLLYSYGFDEPTNVVFRLSRSLHGIRYETVENKPYKKFEKPYMVQVSVPRTGTDTAKSVALTPAGLAYDTFILPIVIVGWWGASQL